MIELEIDLIFATFVYISEPLTLGVASLFPVEQYPTNEISQSTNTTTITYIHSKPKEKKYHRVNIFPHIITNVFRDFSST